MNKMKCPFCGETLKRGENRRYTDTSDHVFDPNGTRERPPRVTWVCSCYASTDCFWDASGGFYSGESSLSHPQLQNILPSDNCWAAVGSWDEWVDKRNKFGKIVYRFLFFKSGNDRYFLSSKIARFVYKFSEPEFQY